MTWLGYGLVWALLLAVVVVTAVVTNIRDQRAMAEHRREAAQRARDWEWPR